MKSLKHYLLFIICCLLGLHIITTGVHAHHENSCEGFDDLYSNYVFSTGSSGTQVKYHSLSGAPKSLEGVDIDSFEILRGEYAKDKYRAYHSGEVISGAIGSGFHVISSSITYAKDSNYVYALGKKIATTDSIDWDTFHVSPGEVYAFDDENVFHYDQKLVAQGKYFQIMDENYLYNYGIETQQQYLFYEGELLGKYEKIVPVSPILFMTSRNVFGPLGKVGSIVGKATVRQNPHLTGDEIDWIGYGVNVAELAEIISLENNKEDLVKENLGNNKTIIDDSYFIYYGYGEEGFRRCTDVVGPFFDIVVLPKKSLIDRLKLRASRLSQNKKIAYITTLNAKMKNDDDLTPQQHTLASVALRVLQEN